MAKELIYKVRIDYDADSASRGGQRLERSQENAEQAVDKTTQAIKRQQEASETSARSQRNFQKATSNANQTLFTFGDLINDAQQFQFGFAQGSRAIGNNIAFAAEQISNTSTRAGGFRNTLKALAGSLLGPGGIILAVNVAVTALTVFGDALFDTQDKAELVKKEIDELGDTVQRFNDLAKALADEGIFGEDPFDLSQLQDEQSRINRRLEENKRILDELGFSEENLARIQELRNLRNQEGIDLTADQLRELRDLISQQRVGADVVEEYREENAQLEARLEQINTKIDEQRQKQEDLNAVTGGLTLGLTDLEKKYIDLSLDIAAFNDQLAESVNQIGNVSRAASIEVDTTFLQPQRGVDELIDEDPFTELPKTAMQREQEILDQRIDNFRGFEETKTAIQEINERQRAELTRQAVSQSIGALASAFDQFKPLAVAQAVIDGVLAVQKVLANVPPPFNFAAAAAMGAATLKNVQKIIATEPGSSSSGSGGAENVGGRRATGGRSGISGGFSTGEISANRINNLGRNQQTLNVIIEGNISDADINVRSERGRKERVSKSIRVGNI